MQSASGTPYVGAVSNHGQKINQFLWDSAESEKKQEGMAHVCNAASPAFGLRHTEFSHFSNPTAKYEDSTDIQIPVLTICPGNCRVCHTPWHI